MSELKCLFSEEIDLLDDLTSFLQGCGKPNLVKFKDEAAIPNQELNKDALRSIFPMLVTDGAPDGANLDHHFELICAYIDTSLGDEQIDGLFREVLLTCFTAEYEEAALEVLGCVEEACNLYHTDVYPWCFKTEISKLNFIRVLWFATYCHFFYSISESRIIDLLKSYKFVPNIIGVRLEAVTSSS